MSYVYSTAKHRRSGSTMQKMPTRGALDRKLLAAETRPGYPWSEMFRSRAAVDAYLSGDQVTCLLCGKPYIFLAPHIKRTHGLPAEQYKVRFGIPQNRGLCGRDFSEQHSANSKARGFGLDSKTEMPWLLSRKPTNPHVPWLLREAGARVRPFSGRRTYKDGEFEWHLRECASGAFYQKPPPAGHASWSTFKKRRNKDPELQERFYEARHLGRAA